MSDTTTYRVTVNDSAQIWTSYPGERWSAIAQVCEDRGWTATLERRDVFEFEDCESRDLFLAGVCNDAAYMRLGNRVVCPWRVIAEMEPHTALIVGG